VANQLREILPQLSPKQAAALRSKYNADPEAMLREARKLHEHIYGSGDATGGDATPENPNPAADTQSAPPPEAAPTAQQPAKTLEERIDNAFNELEMPDEDRKALRTEYAGREEDLLARLIRTYRRRQAQEGENK